MVTTTIKLGISKTLEQPKTCFTRKQNIEYNSIHHFVGRKKCHDYNRVLLFALLRFLSSYSMYTLLVYGSCLFVAGSFIFLFLCMFIIIQKTFRVLPYFLLVCICFCLLLELRVLMCDNPIGP